MFPGKVQLIIFAEIYARKESHNKVSILPPPNLVKQRWFAIIGIFYRLEEVIRMVGLPKVVLYVIVLRRDSKFYEFVLECPGLLKEAMDFPFDFHIYSSFLNPILPR